jgi:hypothetical protein
LRTYQHACADCHTRSAPDRPAQIRARASRRVPGCEICATDAHRSPELCGDCVYLSCCDYCAASGVPVVRVFYERSGIRVADTVCASCAAAHYVMKGALKESAAAFASRPDQEIG